MTIRSTIVRRVLTTIGVVAALVLGFGSINAAAAWTAASAPLTVAPVSVSSMQDRIATEQARSQALEEQLTGVAGQTEDLTTALEAAQARIATDAETAKGLTADLKAAKARLAKLEATIKKAAAAAARRASVAAATKTSSSGTSTSTSHHDDDEGEDGG